MSSVFYAFLVEHGIKYYHIVPYTLEQNEVVVVQHMYLIGVPLKHCTLSHHMRLGRPKASCCSSACFWLFGICINA